MRYSSQQSFGTVWEEIERREMGFPEPGAFRRRVGGSEAFVKRLYLYGKLEGHRACVNSVNFNSSGNILVSGSDDKQIIFWDWAIKSKKLSYNSGHHDNVFQAKFMPFTDDMRVISAGADGQVRLGQIGESGAVNTKRLGKHEGRIHKLAIEPGSPNIFYSCGEDGFVQHFDLRSSSGRKLFGCISLSGSRRPIRLQTIEINPCNSNYFSIGGCDQFARVYDVRNIKTDGSGNCDRPVDTFCPPHLIRNKQAHVTGLAYSRSNEFVVSYNDELIYLFQKSMGMGPDPKSVTQEKLQVADKAQVYSGHRNSRTVKAVSFFGPSEDYVVSGSDCGHVFIWRKKDGKLLRMMRGDKHIVNCVEPHPTVPYLATSGLDESAKLWLPIAPEPTLLPDNAEKIMESNKRGREQGTTVLMSSDRIGELLGLPGRPGLRLAGRRQTSRESDSDDEPVFYLGFGDENEEGSSDEGGTIECSIC